MGAPLRVRNGDGQRHAWADCHGSGDADGETFAVLRCAYYYALLSCGCVGGSAVADKCEESWPYTG